MKKQISSIRLSLFEALSVALGTNVSAEFKFSSVEWDELFSQAQKQEVLALAFDGVNKSKNNLSLQQKTKWGFLVVPLKQRNLHQKQVVFKLRDALAVHDIPLMILKGLGFSRSYPNPALRECGDIDIYTLGHYSESNELFVSSGVQIKSEDEKHCAFSYDGVEVENHLKMNYDLNHANNVLGREFATRFDQNPEIDPDYPGIMFPERNICALHMMMHTISHLAWSGISLRHLVDWTMFLRRYAEQLDFGYLDSIWRESALASTVGILTRICNEYLGVVPFPLDYDSMYLEKDYEYILSDILKPSETPSEYKSLLKKILIKTDRYFRRCRKHKIVYKEPFPDSYLKDIGITKLLCQSSPK